MAKNEKGKKEQSRGRPPGLGGLADALIQAGHLSEDRALEIARQKRRQERTGAEPRPRERREQETAERQALRAAQAAKHREEAAAAGSGSAAERALKAIRQGVPRGGWGGNRRWYYVARDGRVPFLDVGDGIAQKLGSGDAGIVEAPDDAPGHDDHCVVEGQGPLQTLLAIDPGMVRFWNR